MNVALAIQEKLKNLRVEHHLTLEQLEQRTGISKSALGNYETEDYKDISHTSIVALAKFYGTELHLSDTTIELRKNGNINTRFELAESKH